MNTTFGTCVWAWEAVPCGCSPSGSCSGHRKEGLGQARPARSFDSLFLLPDWMKKKMFLEPHSF